MNEPDRSRSMILNLVVLITLTLAPGTLPAGEVIVTAEVARLLARDGATFDEFGASVSLDGDRVAVASYVDDNDIGFVAGSVYIFERNEDRSWSVVTKILPLDGLEFEHFGFSVSLDGDRLAVGAHRGRDNGSDSGSAYIFDLNVDGKWLQAAKLLPLDGEEFDRFGESISLDGDRVAVGAYLDDDNGTNSGSAYIFERRDDGSWPPVAKVLPLDGTSSDLFGESVSLDGDRLAVGANEDDDNGTDSGSAYVFERNVDGSWSQVAKILSLDGAAVDYFGTSVSLDVDRLAVGAYLDDDNGASSGSAYIFERREDGSWPQVAKVLPLDGASSDLFGESVSLDGDRLAVGANQNDDNGSESGSAYVFERNEGGSWSQVSKILPLSGAEDDFFGVPVSLDGDRVAVGAPDDRDNGYKAGSAFIFDDVLVSPQLSIRGTCPGEIEITRSGTTPRSGIALYHAASEGSFSFDGGPCVGTEIGLEAPDLLKERSGEFQPERTILRTVDDFWCGQFLQLVDEKTCLTSEVIQVP